MGANKLFRKKTLARIMADAENQFFAEEHFPGLKRALKARDLMGFGIAAIVGAGIFSTIGHAAADGGPAVSLLFIFTAIACAFSALCYAEFASMIPVSGSAYTYSYVAFGEIIAWIIGWDLLLEYAIGNIAVAISWSDYFTGLINGLGESGAIKDLLPFQLHIPAWASMDVVSAHRLYLQAQELIAKGTSPDTFEIPMKEGVMAWTNSPQLGGLHLILDLPALAIVILITWLVYRGVKDSRNASNIMVGIKLAVILLVIIVGSFWISPGNWSPFAPHGLAGVMKGVSAVFFAYIGFDAISTTAEECENPKKDLPKGIFGSLIICTVLYVAITLVLTGMVPYSQLSVGNPLEHVFDLLNLKWMGGIIAVSAVIAMASVLLVFQMGQPRIWMSMSRDGLLPKAFSKVHKKYNTPSFSTIFTGFVVGVPLLFMNQNEIVDLTSIGTLFAFVLVCGGILLLKDEDRTGEGKFRVPYISGRYIVPGLFLFGLGVLLYNFMPVWQKFWQFSFETVEAKEASLGKIPLVIFFFGCIALSVFSYLRKLSLIPVLGLASCFYLMTELGYTNWLRFIIWLIVGLCIYFLYGMKRSKLNEDVA